MEKNQRKGFKATAIGLAAILAVTTAGVLYAEKDGKTQETQANLQENQTKGETGATLVNNRSLLDENQNIGKEETVYVMAGAGGSVEKIVVSDWLKNPEKKQQLTDRSDLKDIVNLKGEESYSLDMENRKIWEANGNDIYYQGSTDKELPVEMTISYQLDGKNISAEELAGKSGKVTMRFDYVNRQQTSVTVDGREKTVYVPFAMVTGMILDNQKFTNIQVSNGKLINDGDRSIVMGVALPGLQENLDLDREKLEIPDHVEITADVQDFSLMTTMTVASSDLFHELDLENVETLEELKEAIGELKTASNKLVDGASTLQNGTSTLLEKSGELIAGVDKLYEGSETLKEGAASLYAGAEELKEGAGSLNAGTDTLSVGASGLKQGIEQVNQGAESLNQGAEALSAGITQADAGAANLDAGAAQLNGGLEELTQNNETLCAGAKQIFDLLLANGTEQLRAAGLTLPELTMENYGTVLEQIIGQLQQLGQDTAAASVTGLKTQLEHYQNFYDGIQAYTAGVSQVCVGSRDLKNGTAALKEGTAALKEGAAQLQSGTAELKAGTTRLASGSKELAGGVLALKEGSQKLSAGSRALAEGAAALSEGAAELYAGIGTLKDGGGALVDGVAQLNEGALQLSNGMKEFHEQGIRKLADAFDGDIKDLLDRLKATVQASKEYQNFSGISEDMNGSVKFIFRTEGIGE